jgi:hypothetical protein
MSTPTTIKLQIAVSSTDENGQITHSRYFVDMNVISESGEAFGIELFPSTSTASEGSESTGEPLIVPPSEVMPPQDPPRTQVAISLAA